jgi:lipid-A-disaccharide synthase
MSSQLSGYTDMKLYIIAGEASGDLHGSNLIRALHHESADITVRAWGGDAMREAGAEVVKHYRELAFMGFAEVLLNIRTILKNLLFCKQDIAQFRPDALILIDYPGFNMRIAQWAKKQGIPVFYYISPQIWAWKENRVQALKRDVQLMCVVLPFEKEFYARHGMQAEFVGHPLLDVRREIKDESQREKIIALLPGSRKQEISTMLPEMLAACAGITDYQIVVAGAPGQEPSFYEPYLKGTNARIIFGQTQELLGKATAGLITSGTATLEAGIIGLPQVVCYKGNFLSYLIARKLIRVKYISLVNLILDRECVPEMIQARMNASTLRKQLEPLLAHSPQRSLQLQGYVELREKLGGSGASERTAKAMLKSLSGLQ